MPVYEYRCTQCEHQFELWQEVGSAAPPCEQCGAEVKKIFHPVRTIFKGSGFYITDTRAEQSKSKPSGEANATAPAKSESSSDAGASTPAASTSSESAVKSEAKPA